MKILLTGDRGYIGAVLGPMLIARGHEITGLDADYFRGCDLGRPEEPGYPRLTCDLRDVTAEQLRGFDAVVHLAALSNDPLGNLDPELTRAINFEASLRVAELAKEGGARRFLFSSSCSSYGAAGDAMLDENAAFNPVTPYAEHKVGLERALSELTDDSFSPTYLRNATAYGLSPRLRLDLVLNNLVGWALSTGKVLLLSDGTPWRPIVHVEDICRAFIAVLDADRGTIHDEAFNVGRSEHNYRILELAEIVADVVPGSRVEIAEGAGPDKRSYRVDFSKLETTLDFQPQWDARKSAERMFAAFKQNNLEQHHLEGPRFIRLKRLEELIERGDLSSSLLWSRDAESAIR